MKGLLFLGLVGAAIYGALVLSYNVLPPDAAEDAFAGRSLGDPSSRELRSWGTDLPALVNTPASTLPTRGPITASPTDTASLPVSEAKPASAQSGGTTYQPVELAKVALAAKVHADASVSSPTLRFYPAGTALQVVSRRNGWVEVADLTSKETGWIFEQYLVAADTPVVPSLAMKATGSKAAAQPTRTAAAKKHVRPAARMPGDVALAQFERRWGRRAERAERRGGFGMFFLGRFARNEAQFR
jgi:Bacterial SH3 domain